MQAENETREGGWKLASVTGGEHLRKTLEMYRELGIETLLEETTPEDCGGCTECYQEGNETIYRVYTRVPHGGRAERPTEETS